MQAAAAPALGHKKGLEPGHTHSLLGSASAPAAASETAGGWPQGHDKTESRAGQCQILRFPRAINGPELVRQLDVHTLRSTSLRPMSNVQRGCFYMVNAGADSTAGGQALSVLPPLAKSG